MSGINKNHIIELADGRTLGYIEYGDPHGKPIFYFHGWPTCRLQIEYADEIAKNLKIRVIAIDRPGFGISEYKPNRTILDWPDDVIELADQLKIKKFSMLGVSGGGPYAAVCGYKIPERIDKIAIVVGLAPTYIPHILDDYKWYNRIGWQNFAKHKSVRYLASILQYINAKYIPSMIYYRHFFWSAPDRKLFGDKKMVIISQRNLAEAFRQGYRGPMLDLKLYTDDWGFNIADIKKEVFLFYGDTDNNVPLAMGKYYASQIKNSKLRIYPGEGHLISKTHIEKILKVLIG